MILLISLTPLLLAFTQKVKYFTGFHTESKNILLAFTQDNLAFTQKCLAFTQKCFYRTFISKGFKGCFFLRNYSITILLFHKRKRSLFSFSFFKKFKETKKLKKERIRLQLYKKITIERFKTPLK